MRPEDARLPTADSPASATTAATGVDEDERAIARYLYLLRTAPPDAIEQVHAEAFRALTDSQRQELLARIAQVLPPYERALATPVNGTPVGLARLITRAEMRQPGTVARLFGAGTSVAGALGASLLGGIAGAVVGSAIAAPFLAGAALAGATSAGDLVADAGSDDDGGFDFGLDDPFDV
jgi:hypothetical protein